MSVGKRGMVRSSPVLETDFLLFRFRTIARSFQARFSKLALRLAQLDRAEAELGQAQPAIAREFA
jgi:hypothetical protein